MATAHTSANLSKTEVCVVDLFAVLFGGQRIKAFREKVEWNTGIRRATLNWQNRINSKRPDEQPTEQKSNENQADQIGGEECRKHLFCETPFENQNI